MPDQNETNRPANSRKKAARRIAAGAAGALALLAALALFCPGVGLLRAGTPAPAAVEETPSPLPAASAAPTPTPTPEYRAGYLRCENGLFRPADALTAREAADAVSAAAGLSVSVSSPAEALTETSLAALLADLFPAEDIRSAMDAIAQHGSESVTRAEAAVFFNRLFGLNAADAETDFYPDVVPGEWGSGDIYTAASGAAAWDGANGRPDEGVLLIDAQLYCAGADGYFIKNAYCGSLYFDNAGRYTSGDAELDGYVTAALRSETEEGMTRDEMLRAMYLYVRDSFSYLTRHYYKIGDVGWAMSEALTMYSTGRGNCYCYAAAFWAAARALGFDAKIVSGTYGADNAPHGWVEIVRDGTRYTYDVEIEMAIRRDGGTGDLYEMTDAARSRHGYREAVVTDDMLPRSMSGVLPG